MMMVMMIGGMANVMSDIRNFLNLVAAGGPEPMQCTIYVLGSVYIEDRIPLYYCD